MYICHVRRRMQGLIFFRFLRIKTLNPASLLAIQITRPLGQIIRHMESFKVCKMFSQLFRLHILYMEYLVMVFSSKFYKH